MNFTVWAPWLLTVVALCWGVWLTFRKESASSVSMRILGFLAAIILLLIGFAILLGLLPLQTQHPNLSPVIQQSEASPTTPTPAFVPTSTPTPSQLGLSLIEKHKHTSLCEMHAWSETSTVVRMQVDWSEYYWEAMHIVQSGETLDSIAIRYDKGIYMNMQQLSLSAGDTPSTSDNMKLAGYYEEALKEWTRQITTTNGLVDPSDIIPGRVLIIPGLSGECGGGPIIIVTPVPTVLPGPIIHIVERGDTLYSISKHYNRSVQAIMTASGIRSDVIRVGDRLIIPSR